MNKNVAYDPTITVNGVTLTNTNSLKVTTQATINTATAISPTSASPVLKTPLTVTFDNTFGATLVASDFTIVLTSTTDSKKFYPVNVVSVDDSAKTIKLMFGGATSGTYSITIEHKSVGMIDVTSLANFEVKSTVTAISPTTGSYYGGTLITITGTNFGTEKTDNPV